MMGRIFQRVVIAGFIFLGSALIYFQLIQYNRFQNLSSANRIRILPQPASRGRILDRNGNILAANRLSYNLFFLPQGANPIRDNPNQNLVRDEIFRKLSQIMGVSEGQLKSRYIKGYSAPFVPVLLGEDISIREAIAIEELKWDLPAVIIQAIPIRTYPQANFSSHLLGYLSEIDVWRLTRLKEYGYKPRDLVGTGGIEEIYDYILRPQDGGMQIEVDSHGRLSRVLGYKAGENGRDIQLTIDLRLQKIAQKSLSGSTGTVVILNPDNGDVLTLVSFPDFNPLDIKPVLNDPDAPLLNRAINGLYPPGSVFKLVVAAAGLAPSLIGIGRAIPVGLEKKRLSRNATFFCPGSLKIGDRKFACWQEHGETDIIKAISHSCNVFFYNLGLKLGPQIINEYALKFGLGQPSRIDLPGESSGFLPYSLWGRIKRRQAWFDGDTANLSIGQGEVLVTPIQIARLMAVFANGGRLIKPRLLKSINEENYILESKPEVINLTLSKETLDIMRSGLIGAVADSGGTAHILAQLGISIAGKTGTAQVSSGQPHGWFVGYFPADKPRFVICVFLEHAGSGYYSCLVAKKIIEQMLSSGLL